MVIDRRFAMVVSLLLTCRVAMAQAVQRDSVEDEHAYAVAVAAIADSAIHRLDFFPDKAQLRVQMAFLSAPHDPAAVPFGQIASMSAAVATAVDESIQRFAAVVVPPDLQSLHRDLVKSLRAAATAADHLSMAATACRVDAASVQRCQSPFTAASTRLSTAYRDYLAVRTKISGQVLDTETHLAVFKVANR